ncbi:MAG: response regulator, partial [Kangiellaceae bacterium]|nr:response regulator [Kangiellaceae bacterium]
MRILHIEPNSLTKQLTDSVTQEINCRICHVDNFSEAINQLKKQSFDAIFSTAEPEGRDATLFCEKIRQRDEIKYTPFVIYSKDLSAHLQVNCSERGVTELINQADLGEKVLDYYTRYTNTHSDIDGRVLVVEDSESQRIALHHLIETTGITVDSCGSVETACDLISKHHYHLIITDVFLSSEYTALELVSQVKNLSKPKNLSFIIAISSFNDASRRLELLN